MKSSQEIVGYLESLFQHYDPFIQAAALYVIAQLDSAQAKTIAHNLHDESHHPIVREAATQILSLPAPHPLTAFPRLEKMVYLLNSDFFHGMRTETLIALADRSQMKTYSMGDVITESGDTCRELLLLIEGDAKIHYQLADHLYVERLHPGQMLDELEVLTHSNMENTIIADGKKTRILAVPVDTFDDLLDHDSDFARRVLELESWHLQQFVRPVR